MTISFEHSCQLHTPVLFLVFNRPRQTEIVFSAIRNAKPLRLYIACDGPRPNLKKDSELIEQVQQIVSAVDWQCETYTLFRDVNIGCKLAVSEAISWFFNHEDCGIILEDDCVPSQSFFWFCQICLELFKYDKNVMAITGLNIAGSMPKYDSFFSNFPLMWGWATWADSWHKYDLTMAEWPKFRADSAILRLSIGNLPFMLEISDAIQQTYDGFIDTWDYQWIFCCWLNRGLTVAPSLNLIENIGFDEFASHTHIQPAYLRDLKSHELNWPILVDRSLEVNKNADRFIAKHFFNGSWKYILKSRFLRLLSLVRSND